MNQQTTVSRGSERFIEEAAASRRKNTIGAAIQHLAGVQPDHLAVVSSGFASLSYSELQSIISHIRAGLRAEGLDRESRIAIAMPSGPYAALAIVGISCSAISIPVNPRQTFRETEALFKALRPDAILLMRGTESTARQVAELRGIKILEATPIREGHLAFSFNKARIAPAESDDGPDPETPAFIFQTSGTTAEPKMIPFSHQNMLAAAARLQSWFNLTPQDRCLSVSPPFYSHGLKVTVFTPLLTGGTISFPTDASKFDYSEWFGELQPTWYSAGPTLHRLVFDQTRNGPNSNVYHALRFILSGGAPLPQDVLEGLQRALGVTVVEHYGSSEAAQIAANLPPPGRSKQGTCGVPWPGTVKIVAEDGHSLGAGEKGEILVGGPTVIKGYLNAPKLNQECFVEGWLKTGDIGSVDEDGFLTLHGRKNEIINRGGEKISPAEIDELLLRHPAVADAAAFSVPHSRLGEDVAAAVVLRSGMTASPAELRVFLQDKLASFKIPRRIFIRDSLPKGKTGKVLRRQLTESGEVKGTAQTKISTLQSSDDTAYSTLVIQLTELWERLLQTTPVSIDDNFFEKGGDSLLAMEMLIELESLTGLTIPSSILFEATTIRQVARVLFELDIRPKPITKMNQNGTLAPIFLFHGDYNGGGLYAARLAKAFGPDQPLFVVAPHDLGKEPLALPIEAIAADRLPLILDAQAKGPYRLCGYCLGGLVAFEVARLLIAAGEKVEFVGMIDSPTVSARRYLQLILSTMRYLRPIASSPIDYAMRRILYFCSQLDMPTSSTKSWSGKVFKWHSSERLSSLLGLVSYSPRPLPLPVIYFAAEYGSAAWRRISSDVDTVQIDADHAGVVRDSASLAIIAEHLRRKH